jgi:hypothetical protein
VTRVAHAARGVWHAALELAGTRRGAMFLALAAVVVWIVQSLGWPLEAGRDSSAYLLVYVDLFDREVVFPWAMLNRTPLSALALGGTLELGHPVLLEAVAACLFAGSVVAGALAARTFGRGPAVLVAVGLLLYPGYGIVFHGLTGDTFYAAAFAGWTLLAVRVAASPSTRGFAAVGLGVSALVLMRPSSLPLGAVILALPLFTGGAVRLRLARAGVLLVALGLPLVAWSIHNAVRFDDLALVRGGNASLPLFRALITDHIVEPDNGPASQELAQLVERKLLTVEPYRSYGIDLQTFFGEGGARIHEDLISLSDREYGWDSDYAILGRVGREAVKAHPGAYAKGVARSFFDLLDQPLFAGRVAAVDPVSTNGAPGDVAAGTASDSNTIVVNGVTLPRPTEGEPIPSEHASAQASTPDGSIREVWTSPTAHTLVFDDPQREAELFANGRRIDDLVSHFPDRRWSPWLGLQMDRSSKLYPRLWMLVLVGLVGIALRKPWGARIAGVIAAGVLAVLFVTALTVYAVPDYAVVLSPALLLLAAIGLAGDRARPH